MNQLREAQNVRAEVSVCTNQLQRRHSQTFSGDFQYEIVHHVNVAPCYSDGRKISDWKSFWLKLAERSVESLRCGKGV